MIRLHRTTAVFPEWWPARGRTDGDNMPPQARHLIRLALACHAAGVPYELEWGRKTNHVYAGFCGTLTVRNVASIPDAKPLPKCIDRPKVRAWKPRIIEAEYRTEAYSIGDSHRQWRSGFVIEHSSGLSLVRPSAEGDWQNDRYDTRTPQQDWRVTHTLSGCGFGLELSFSRAVDCLLLAASLTDWARPLYEIRGQPDLRRIMDRVQAEFGRGWERRQARHRLEWAAQRAA